MIMIIITNSLFLLYFFSLRLPYQRLWTMLSGVTWGVSDEIRSVSNKAIKYYSKE